MTKRGLTPDSPSSGCSAAGAPPRCRPSLRRPRRRTGAAFCDGSSPSVSVQAREDRRTPPPAAAHADRDAPRGRRGAGDQLAVDARLVAVGERVRHLDDHHAIEQRLVLLFLQELVELGEVGVREDGLVEVDQREARHLDVLFLRQRQQQVEELALHLEDLDHLEHAAAGGIDRAGPRPGARIALVADFGDLGQVDRTDQVGDVGGGRIVRRIGADADPRSASERKMRSTGNCMKSPCELPSSRARRKGGQLAGDVDAVGLAELRRRLRESG